MKRERSVIAQRKRVGRFQRPLPAAGTRRLRASGAAAPGDPAPSPGLPARPFPRTLGTPFSPTAMSQEIPPPSAPRFYKWGVSLLSEGVCVVPKCWRGAGSIPILPAFISIINRPPHQPFLPIPTRTRAQRVTPLAVKMVHLPSGPPPRGSRG